MRLTLPKSLSENSQTIETNGHPLVIVGANGAGKSRFTNSLEKETADKAFSLSALHGLYVTDEKVGKSSIGRLYNETSRSPININDKPPTELDLLLTMLMSDEMANLLNYKLSKADGNEVGMSETRLDKVIALWQEVFPGNRILIESGRMLFGRDNDNDRYTSLKLSDGEKAAIYYIAGVLYAPQNAAIFINSPEIFMHPSIMESLWTRIELLRPDCTFIYTTHDLEFTSSRTGATIIWVREYDAAKNEWDYNIIDNTVALSEDVYKAIIGARRPVLFIEGDETHSIDSKLYPLVFKEFSVKSLGSCNKVIEATRTFNDLNGLHHLDSYGIVDRDRRDAHEVGYLRGKRIMVPDVAEIENIMMLEDVIKAVARSRGCDENRVFAKVSSAIINLFEAELHKQALMHTRHKVKRTVEYRIDGRFSNITMLEEHIKKLYDEIQPRRIYDHLCREFHQYVSERDYASILRVYNQKTMIASSNLPQLCKFRNKDEYIACVIDILRNDNTEAKVIRKAIKNCFGLTNN